MTITRFGAALAAVAAPAVLLAVPGTASADIQLRAHGMTNSTIQFWVTVSPASNCTVVATRHGGGAVPQTQVGIANPTFSGVFTNVSPGIYDVNANCGGQNATYRNVIVLSADNLPPLRLGGL